MSVLKDVSEREAAYGALHDDILRRQLSNCENLDKSVLTLSSAALGLSLTFIRNIIDAGSIHYKPLLIIAWGLFTLAIVVTIASFLLSNAGLDAQLKNAELYYLRGDESAFNRKNTAATLTHRAAFISAIAFVAGIVCFVIFISFNLDK